MDVLPLDLDSLRNILYIPVLGLLMRIIEVLLWFSSLISVQRTLAVRPVNLDRSEIGADMVNSG